MTLIQFDDSLLSSLSGKVAIVTGIAYHYSERLMEGGAKGIGRATVELFHRHGAYVVFGDVNDEEGIQFEKKLGTYDPFPFVANLDAVHIYARMYSHGRRYQLSSLQR